MAFTLKMPSITMPDMPSITEIVNAADTHLFNAATAAGKFLDTHPGIAILLSPQTLTRRAAQKHVDRMVDYD